MRSIAFSLGLFLTSSLLAPAWASEQEPILADLTCKLYGPQGDWKYKNVVEVRAILKKSDIDKANREGNLSAGCKDDEFLVPSVLSKGGQAEIALVANICGESEVYWYARMRSAALFPQGGVIAFGINPTTYNRLSLGAEGEKEDKFELDGEKFKFLYLDCRPTSLFKK